LDPYAMLAAKVVCAL